MVSILSIDFDYFIAATAQERELYFPPGADEIAGDKLQSMWEERYRLFPQLRGIGVTAQFFAMKNFLALSRVGRDRLFTSDTHKSIKRLIDAVPKRQPVSIVNIDFHHDYYHFFRGGNYLNCGNWLRRVLEERPETRVKWIRREDSQIHSLEGEVPFEHTTELQSIFHRYYDLVFICRSPEWSPPHLSSRYQELVSSVLGSESA